MKPASLRGLKYCVVSKGYDAGIVFYYQLRYLCSGGVIRLHLDRAEVCR